MDIDVPEENTFGVPPVATTIDRDFHQLMTNIYRMQSEKDSGAVLAEMEKHATGYSTISLTRYSEPFEDDFTYSISGLLDPKALVFIIEQDGSLTHSQDKNINFVAKGQNRVSKDILVLMMIEEQKMTQNYVLKPNRTFFNGFLQFKSLRCTFYFDRSDGKMQTMVESKERFLNIKNYLFNKLKLI